MDAFNYLSVLLSIILGLAITQILKGVRGMVLARSHVVPYWPTFVLAALLFVINVQTWWASFGYRNISVWTFPMFAAVLLQITLLYVLAALVLPDFFGEHTVDLRAHYFAHRQLFFSLFVITLFVSIAKDVVLGGPPPIVGPGSSAPIQDSFPIDRVNLAFQLGFLLFCAGGVVTAREWYHKVFCVLCASAFVVYIALLYARLR